MISIESQSSLNSINQFYGLKSITVSIPLENSKYFPIEKAAMPVATAVPAFGLTTAAIASVLGLGAVSAGGGGGSGGGGCAGSCPSVSISANSSSIYDSDSSGFSLTVNLDQISSEPVVVNLQSTGTATLSSDFNGASSVTIAAGSTSSSTSYIPVADSVYEGTETITIEVSSVTNGTENGTQSASVTLKEYALRLGTAFVDRGNSAARAALTEYANVGNFSGVVSPIHPYSLLNVHKAHAYWNGTQHLSGKGEVIHIADFNCDENHVEFTQGGKTTHLVGPAPQPDAAGTGNHHCQLVAGFAAGGFSGSSSSTDIMGVAYEADLVFSRIPGTSYAQKAADLDSARGLNAIVSNNSWSTSCADEASDVDDFIAANPSASVIEAVGGILAGCGTISSSATTQMQAYVDAIDAFQTAGGIMVFAAGNDNTDSDVSSLAALPLWFSQLSEAYLSVAYMEVRGSPTIAGSQFFQLSNPCQQMAERCLVADAWEVFGAAWHDENTGTSHYGDVTGGGSSSASPMVSGIIALLNQAFPNHTPEMIVDRLLASANNSWFTPVGNTTFTTHGNSIKHGFHRTWGHGIPDAYAALSPITTNLNPLIGISTGGSMVNNADNFPHLFPPSQTELAASGSFGDSLINGLKGEYGYFYDALGGGFRFGLNTIIKLPENKINIKDVVYEDLIKLNDYYGFKNNYDTEFINIIGSIGDKSYFRTSVSIDAPSIPIQYFNRINSNSISYKSYSNNPFLNNKNRGLGINTEYSYGNKKFMFGLHDTGKQTGLFISDTNNSQTISSAYVQKNKYIDHLAIISGLMIEEETLFGAKQSGAVGLDGINPKSFFTGLDIEKNINEELTFKLNGTLARTRINNPDRSLIHSYSPITSSSFNFLINKKNILNQNDMLDISIGQPNRIENGTMKFKIQELADIEGNIDYHLKNINLEPSGRQVDLSLNYIQKVSKNFIFGIKNTFSRDLNHYNDSNINHLITTSVSIKF